MVRIIVNNSPNKHISVLLNESIKALDIKPSGVYVDATFGRGGHSREILQHLNQDGLLIGIDRDLTAQAYAAEHFDLKDRKSTRLNSSHVSNSYADFCLKRKISKS